MAKGNNRKERKRRLRAELPIYEDAPLGIMPKKYLEKRVKRYVMATVDTGQYLVVIPGKNQYMFTNNIIRATKCESAFDAKTVIRDYYTDTGDIKLDMVVIPLEITYELINETVDSSIDDGEYMEDINNWKRLN